MVHLDASQEREGSARCADNILILGLVHTATASLRQSTDLNDFAWVVIDGPTMHFAIAPCKVIEIRRLMEADGGSVNGPLQLWKCFHRCGSLPCWGKLTPVA